MRVLLLNPPFGGIYYRLGFIFPPLGLAYIAAVLKQEGHEVSIIDCAVEPDGLNILDREKFDLVGISGDTCRHNKALDLAVEVKKRGVPTVLGGPHVSYLDKEILDAHESVDFIVRREGELTLLALVNKFGQPGDYESIPGITFRDQKGFIVRNEDRPFVSDLDTLPPPARELLSMDRYRRLELRRRKITPIVTSRGCPFRCPFCCSSEFAGTQWRTHSTERVLSEIEDVTANYGYDAVAFIDDTFTINMQRVQEISREIVNRNIDIRWWCFTRSDIVLKHEEIVKDMAASGARYVFMGMESGEEHILNRLKQGVAPHRGEDAIRLLLKYGIETMASYMFGDLEETQESAERTITFARAQPTGAAQFSILTPFPGTVLFDEMESLLVHKNWDLYDCTHSVFKHPNLTHEQLTRLHSRAYWRYYLTPKRLLVGLFSFIRGKGVKLSKILPVLFSRDK